MMTNREAVTEVLKVHGCQDSKHIAMDAMRLFGHSMTASAVGGVLRAMYKAGEVGSSNCGAGSTVYWLNV